MADKKTDLMGWGVIDPGEPKEPENAGPPPEPHPNEIATRASEASSGGS